MDWQQLFTEQVLPGLLTVLAIVVTYYLKQGLAKWAAQAEGDTIAGKAYRLVLAAWQLYKDSPQVEAAKKKMLDYAVKMLMQTFPKLTEEQARAEVEAAVREAKSTGSIPAASTTFHCLRHF